MEPPDPDEYVDTKPIMKLGDLLDSQLVGLLEDLDPKLSSVDVARALRDRASQRWAT